MRYAIIGCAAGIVPTHLRALAQLPGAQIVGMADISAFSVHPFAVGDYIVQSGPPKDGQATEYALLHTLTDGVYQVIPVDEDDADQATRTAQCRPVDKSYCLIETRDELLAFARATATRHRTDGGLVIRLPDVAEREDHKP